MAEVTRIAISATTAPWARALRSHVRDHAAGVEIETLLDPRQLWRSGHQFHVLVVDDVARIFGASSVASATRAGIFVMGLCDELNGMGRGYLERLGVQLILPESTRPEDLIEAVGQVAVVPAVVPPIPGSGVPAGAVSARLSVWYSVSGGAGLTEALVAAAELLAHRSRVLVIEADPLSSVLAARLNRSASSGLAWSLNRLAQGLPCLPGRSTDVDEGGTPLGSFDVICRGAAGLGLILEDGQLDRIVDEAVQTYDHVLVAGGPLVSASAAGGRERLAVGRALLARADVALAWAVCDPLGALAGC